MKTQETPMQWARESSSIARLFPPPPSINTIIRHAMKRFRLFTVIWNKRVNGRKHAADEFCWRGGGWKGAKEISLSHTHTHTHTKKKKKKSPTKNNNTTKHRERERERQRDRQTDRQTDRQRQRGRHRERERERERDRVQNRVATTVAIIIIQRR